MVPDAGGAPAEFHPERIPGDPATVRWVVPRHARHAPAREGRALRRLIEQGVLADVAIQPATESAGRAGMTGLALLTVLAEGRTWREDGATVRDAVRESVTESVTVDAAAGAHDDAALRAVVLDVLAGPAGSYVGSHGGRAELVAVAEGRVTLRLGGACTHCPAAGVTIERTLEREIRTRYPALVEVRREPGGGRGGRLRRSLGRLRDG